MIVIIVVLIVGALWYYTSIQPMAGQSVDVHNQDAPALACDSNSSTTLLEFEDQAEGFAFCYPSDLVISTDTNNIDSGIHDMTWPTPYKDPVMGNTADPNLSFVVLRSNSSSINTSLPRCDLSGASGDYWCVPPPQSQITQGKSIGGLSYTFFRADFEQNNTVVGTSSGPYAYVDLGSGSYLVFQAPVAAVLPSYVDSDLKEILNMVVTLPVE
jgi:hypothetical protein